MSNVERQDAAIKADVSEEGAIAEEPAFITILEPGRAEKNYWCDLWNFRQLFQVLAQRDISVRYKQTVIGIAWALIRPFLTMIIFTVIFGRVANLPSEGNAPYALMVFAAMLPWQFFATALGEASGSLVANANLISKVYFPRMIVPTATMVVGFVDFVISFVILIGLMVWFQFVPSWHILLVPVFTLVAILAALGPGLWITALNVKYRDFRYIIPFVVQFGLYVSPVGFSSSVIREKFGETAFIIYSANPMVGVIDGFRWCILGGQSEPYWPGFGLGLLFTIVLLFLGIRQFRKLERSFADII